MVVLVWSGPGPDSDSDSDADFGSLAMCELQAVAKSDKLTERHG